LPLLEKLVRLLENAFDILEQPDTLLADFDHLFEQLANVLEEEDFIRTILNILEQSDSLLENYSTLSGK